MLHLKIDKKMAAEKGFEPLRTDPESVVLPLHHSAAMFCDVMYLNHVDYYTCIIISCQHLFHVFLIFLKNFFKKRFQKNNGMKNSWNLV